MTGLTALILDDDSTRADIIAACLEGEGFTLAQCHDDVTLPDFVKRAAVDICLVGPRALGRDGYDIVRELRLASPAGILMLGKSGDEIDTVLALEMGADDYMTSPVRPRELCARIRTILRRTVITPPDATGARPLPDSFMRRVDDVEICGVLRMVSVSGRVVDLTPSEFDVLMVLAANTNAVLSREGIIASVKGGGFAINDRSVDGVISRLRRKLFDAEEGANRIRTIHGRGYMLIERGGTPPR
jgi:DNA-binding response OmpR family regulator